ncbi:MAG: stage 0 sporulation protein [Desulfobacterales bacterium C00003106]|jgi:cell fate regulator YaaT (PSP1 superfamily)|nr:MAG: stage 0 sporulation protein [Desulfobacterales bacterium C00003106]
MNKIVGIKFKQEGKAYDFDPGPYVLDRGDYVIVETERGFGFGTVSTPSKHTEPSKIRKDLKKIFRPANEDDIKQHLENLALEKRAYKSCLGYISELGLIMNLVDVECLFDGSKIIFYFTADGRVDFRELVKKLVYEFSVRIEMRQIGVRNKAKMCGGLGRCGREVCCASFIQQFSPVSVKMAKIQHLSLNPTKISGACGRLMCCLAFEYDTYCNLKNESPKSGTTVRTEKGTGRVIRQDILRGCVVVQFENGTQAEFSSDRIREVKPEPGRAKKRTYRKYKSKEKKTKNES